MCNGEYIPFLFPYKKSVPAAMEMYVEKSLVLLYSNINCLLNIKLTNL